MGTHDEHTALLEAVLAEIRALRRDIFLRASAAEEEKTAEHLYSSDEAARYLGFRTRAGIRHCIYRGELAPDGRGYN